MDKKSLLGMFLIGGILMFWLYLKKTDIQRLTPAAQDSQLHVAHDAQEKAIAEDREQFAKLDTLKPTIIVNNDSLNTAQQTDYYRDFYPSTKGKMESYILENNKIKVTFSSRGGKISSVEMKEYFMPDRKTKVSLFNPDSSLQEVVFQAFTDNRRISTDSLCFQATNTDKTAKGNSLVLRLPSSNPGSYIEYAYTLKENDYLVEMQIRLVGLQKIISDNSDQLIFNWKMLCPSQEEHVEKERQASTAYWKYVAEDPDNISLGKEEVKDISTAPIQWVAFKQQFFTAAVMNEKGFLKDLSRITTGNVSTFSNNVKRFGTELGIPYRHTQNEKFEMKFFFGPNHYNTLQKYDVGFEKMINIGWPVFNLINRWLVIPVFNALSNDSMISYGIIILLLTFIIKIILFPVAYKTYISSSKMRLLKPELEGINKKFPDTSDAMKKNQEQMALYKRAGASPFSGCIPALLQFPILIALLNFFPASIELRQKPFLWAQDLSTYDSIWTYGNIPIINSVYGDHVSLFALLMFVSTIIYTWMNNKYYTPATQQQMPGMKFMMYFMPVIFLSFMNSYSSGLSWYYFLANMITFGQTYVMRKFVSDEKLRDGIEAQMKKPVKKSSFQQRLEDMAKQRGAPQKRK